MENMRFLAGEERITKDVVLDDRMVDLGEVERARAALGLQLELEQVVLSAQVYDNTMGYLVYCQNSNGVALVDPGTHHVLAVVPATVWSAALDAITMYGLGRPYADTTDAEKREALTCLVGAFDE